MKNYTLISLRIEMTKVTPEYTIYTKELTNGIDLFLLLNKKNSMFKEYERRNIGSIIIDYDKKLMTYLKKLTKDCHKHYKSGKYGFNHEVIRSMREKDKIELFIPLGADSGRYRISHEKFTKKKEYMQFKGFEKQVFVPLNEFSKVG